MNNNKYIWYYPNITPIKLPNQIKSHNDSQEHDIPVTSETSMLDDWNAVNEESLKIQRE